MRPLPIFATAFLLAASAFGAAEITPANPAVPLFRVFIGIPPQGGGKGMAFDEKRPLLTVRAVRELGLGRDDKSVQITLTPDNARDLALLTRKYDKGFLLLEVQGRVLAAIHVSKPIQNGVLGFKHPQDAIIAEYLRKRFRIGEFR
jgi:hypothetical protein